MKYIDNPMREKIITELKEFKQANPWGGTIKQRKEKFRICFHAIAQIANMEGWTLEFDIPDKYSEWAISSNSSTSFTDKKIIMKGRLSVVTLLHEMCHGIIQSREEEEVRFNAISLFCEVFPEKLGPLKLYQGMLVKPKPQNTVANQSVERIKNLFRELPDTNTPANQGAENNGDEMNEP